MVRLLRPDRPRARNYFLRHEQWRLLLLVFALGVVTIAVREIRRPAVSQRLSRAFDAQNAPIVPAKSPPLAPAKPTLGREFGAERQAAELSAEAMATIRDDTYFRTAEKGVWFELVSKLQRTPAAELAAKSAGEVGYAQLAQQPVSYRGKVVTVRGTVRQVTEEKPAANDLGLTSYYRLVLQPAGGEIWPIFVYALELPAEFPRGEKVAVDVSATGYFFKNLSYPWKDGVGIAPVVLAKDITRLDPAQLTQVPAPIAEPRSPVAADKWQDAEAKTRLRADDEVADLSHVLSLAGWDTQRWATFSDDKPLTPEQLQWLVQLLWRLKTFDSVSIASWTQNNVPISDIADRPVEFRGTFVRFSGRVRKLMAHALSAADAERLEMARYFECELVLAGGAGSATILTSHVPQSWTAEFGNEKIDEPATVAGLFIQMLVPDNGRPNVLLVAQQVAADSHGRSALATFGMDIGLLDGIRNHQGILGSERDAFYGILAAMDNVGVNQLTRVARQNLEVFAKLWETDLNSADAARRQLAQEVQRRAAKGLFSVAPLFNDADRQIGQLVVVDGVARRIVRVDTGAESGAGRPNDIARRLGIDHYYEMEVFTDDSQNRPLVFCVRELPPGMSTGDNLSEPVRVAGFFFKSWRYRTRDASPRDDANSGDALGRRLIAPLLIGRGPVRIDVEQDGGQIAELVGGGLFVLALLAIWAAAWWFARGDRRFRQQTAAARFSLPAGQSLDDLNVPVVGEPIKDVVPATTEREKSP